MMRTSLLLLLLLSSPVFAIPMLAPTGDTMTFEVSSPFEGEALFLVSTQSGLLKIFEYGDTVATITSRLLDGYPGYTVWDGDYGSALFLDTLNLSLLYKYASGQGVYSTQSPIPFYGISVTGAEYLPLPGPALLILIGLILLRIQKWQHT